MKLSHHHPQLLLILFSCEQLLHMGTALRENGVNQQHTPKSFSMHTDIFEYTSFCHFLRCECATSSTVRISMQSGMVIQHRLLEKWQRKGSRQQWPRTSDWSTLHNSEDNKRWPLISQKKIYLYGVLASIESVGLCEEVCVVVQPSVTSIQMLIRIQLDFVSDRDWC